MIKLAIQKAIEGGFEDTGDSPEDCIFLDPLFWQALGKSLGWIGTKKFFPHWEPTGNFEIEKGAEMKETIKTQELWLYHQHRFIDHLAENKDPESFFSKLLK